MLVALAIIIGLFFIIVTAGILCFSFTMDLEYEDIEDGNFVLESEHKPLMDGSYGTYESSGGVLSQVPNYTPRTKKTSLTTLSLLHMTPEIISMKKDKTIDLDLDIHDASTTTPLETPEPTDCCSPKTEYPQSNVQITVQDY